MYARYYGFCVRSRGAWHVAREGRVTVGCPLNSEKNGTGSIAPLALFHIALPRANRLFAEPLLALNKHVAVGEHLDNVAQEALRRQRIPPPEDALARFEFATALEECELGRRLHPAEHLSNGELLVKEESLDQRCGDGDSAGRDAGRLAVAHKVDFAALAYWLLGRSLMCAGRCMTIDGLDVDAV